MGTVWCRETGKNIFLYELWISDFSIRYPNTVEQDHFDLNIICIPTNLYYMYVS